MAKYPSMAAETTGILPKKNGTSSQFIELYLLDTIVDPHHIAGEQFLRI
jgi:hypothetical protein